MNTEKIVAQWLGEHIAPDSIDATPEKQAHFQQILCDVCEDCKRAVIDEACEWMENYFPKEVDGYILSLYKGTK